MLLNSVTKFVLILSLQCLIFVSGSIHENVIDTECHHDGDCKVFVKMNQNVTCLNHQCVCRDSDFKTIACLPEKLGLANVIGGKCPCTTIQWSSCMNGFCMCKTGYIPSEDKRSCIPTNLPIGSRCENDAQCSKEIPFSKCANNTCSCEKKFIFHNGTCHSLIDMKKCTNDTECPNSICVQQQCYCKPGYVAAFDETACLPTADYNGNCSESVQCQHELGLRAVCEQGKCVCDENWSTILINVANGTKKICEKRIAVGQECEYDTDCFQSHFNGTEQSMQCFLKECQCAPDYELDQDQRYCIKSKNTELQNTWFDSILSKVSSVFATSSGNRRTINYWINVTMLIICFVVFL
ncbi:hypothetical protein HA402_005924 [Bradysia odoriphaga]|nr:hypothetical protein HA402_005924 [Bradysia odoriphaga]